MPDERKVRRGLPRASGGDPWPPVAAAPGEGDAADGGDRSEAAAAAATPMAADAGQDPAAGVTRRRQGLPRDPGARRELPRDPGPVAGGTAAGTRPRRGLPRAPGAPTAPAERAAASEATPTATAGPASSRRPTAGPERSRGLTKRRWAVTALAAAVALAGAVTVVAVAVRWFLDLGFMRDFLADYPGEYDLPQGAPVGLPGWLNWSHFLNLFLMALIVRTGLQVRRENRPPALWTPKWNGERKISLTVWLHQALDLLWILSGLLFFVLLFTTGQWVRIVPTSWAVFPNALSVLLQYASLEWPTENGWVSYNSLQQLAYFATVFLAAPLAILTGVRLSGLWPKGARALNRVYPIQLARAIHFPVMLYFVAFVVVHVTLVFATGPLRNLNHMFAARGSTDPSEYSSDWTGLCLFLAAVAVTVAGLIATAKPLVIAPIASLFGRVSSR